MGRFIIKGKDQHTSYSAIRGEPMYGPSLRFTCNFSAIFLGWVILPRPQTKSTDQGFLYQRLRRDSNS